MLAYGYGMQSHLVHQDGDVIGMVRDRMQRNTERRTSIDLAHGGRIVSDVCVYAITRANMWLASNGISPDAISRVADKYDPFFDELASAEDHWRSIEYPDTAE